MMMLQFFIPNPDTIIIKNNQSLSSHSTVKNKKGGIDQKLLLKLVKEQNRGIIKHIYLFGFLINVIYNE